mgnify:CR=1 FL=1
MPIGYIKSAGVAHVPIVVVLYLVGVCGSVAVVVVVGSAAKRWNTSNKGWDLGWGIPGWLCRLAWLLGVAWVTGVSIIALRT